MRIDSSGNLLVGKTAIALATVGGELRENGQITGTRDGNASLILNRLTSDGEIAKFYKDGTVRGIIATESDGLIFSNDTRGIKVRDDACLPRNVNLTTADNIIDLGTSGSRFKDLYLGGGAYLGGTGTANYLDDYEEGTWTPSLGDGTYTYSVQEGTYTKIGNRVFVEFRMDLSSATPGASFLRFGSLPFAPTDSNAVGSIRLENVNFNSSASYLVLCNRAVGSGELVIQEIFANAVDQTVSSADISSTSELRGSICFDTSA